MGGIVALVTAFAIILGARRICDLIGAPLWFAKVLFVYAALVATYFLADTVVPDSIKSWGIWVAMIGTASGIMPVGFIMFKHIEDNSKARDSAQYRSK